MSPVSVITISGHKKMLSVHLIVFLSVVTYIVYLVYLLADCFSTTRVRMKLKVGHTQFCDNYNLRVSFYGRQKRHPSKSKFVS
jgi:hypothetical protein